MSYFAITLSTANLVIVLVLFYLGRRALMHWRLALRREVILAEFASEMNYLLADPAATKMDAVGAMNAHGVKFADELNNQLRHGKDLWPRVPRLGKEWPDFEPAKLTFIEVEE